MNGIKLSFDRQGFQTKPSGDEIRYINNRIATSAKKLSPDELKKVVYNIGGNGCTFSPATFEGGKRDKEHFEQQQLVALDFDNKDTDKKISFEEIKERSEFYELPIFFAYDTLSSRNHDKFRVVFLNDVPITDRKSAEAVQMALGGMFPEADPSCYKDVSKLYFGGKKVIYFDDKLPEINIEAVFRNYTYCMKNRYKPNHYKDHIARFAKETGIALTANGLLDVKVTDYLPGTDNPTEDTGAMSYIENGKNSPTTIIYDQDNSNIKANGEIFPNRYYLINFNNSNTRNSSVKTPDKKMKNHKPLRAGVLQDMFTKCRLFHDFSTGIKKLPHDELFGIATNLIHIETGTKYFMEKRLEYQDLYADDNKNRKWKAHLSYMAQHDYAPESCDKYCPYYRECRHCRNILSTVHLKRGMMEKITGYHEEFSTIEKMQEDIYRSIHRAFCANEKKFYVIKAQTGGGKSHSYLKLMEEYPEARFIIAAPTNLLKREIYEKAKRQGIKVMVTPSLEEIKNEIPSGVWNYIQKMYKSGRHYLVHPYIQKQLKKEDVPCLEKYMRKRDKLKTWKGCIVTTHRYLLNMDIDRLNEFDSIIIDEDIIFKSIISNQGEITLSELKRLKRETTNHDLSWKIKKLLKTSKTYSCIKTEKAEWDGEDEEQKTMPFDIPSFCLAEHFYLRRCEKEKNVGEDTFAFLKPAEFPGEKYIIVSATADEEIYKWYFDENNVDFYECKKAAYKGDLMQYPGKSMSRSCLADNQGIVDSLRHRFHMSEDKVITFKNENMGPLHFGNTEGSNTLEGQDILVAGTPYHAEFLYKLAAFSMGIEFDEDEKMALQDVEHNGYRFRFTTFQNKNLRKIHFWMIESELEQAVGRARLLRNICTVHLFSNFPLSQSKMVTDFDYGTN